ncbi:heme NO-binding domain-containing protein [uncultured Draconibacterium sp.]|uniref:heme NO-binding domain-containing protein n=1 Tax=uncultured Draconibacterium sp. TaxID=1573823 RepID=UPI00321723D9
MKGLVFREFLSMVEKEYGYEIVDSIIELSQVHSKGAYTRVGTYPHHEMFALVEQLSKMVDVPEKRLLYLFGRFAFNSFRKGYPAFFEGKKSSFEIFTDVEGIIHVEVLKLYPEAELPTFETNLVNNNEMTMVYRSSRKMGDFAEGLIAECIQHFNEKANVEKKDLEQNGSVVLFTIRMMHE